MLKNIQILKSNYYNPFSIMLALDKCTAVVILNIRHLKSYLKLTIFMQIEAWFV